MTTRVLVADDQALLRAGLSALIGTADGLEVVGEAEHGAQAVELALTTRPDVIVMDIRMPVLDGIAATERILAAATDPPPRILILTTFDLDEYVYRALGAGAAGFLLKETPPLRIIAAVRAVAEGDVLISPGVTHRLVETYALHHRARHPDRTDLAVLTTREVEVLRLVAHGLDNAQIARRLVLSESTVKTHVKNLMGKLGLRSRAQVVIAAYESGLVTPGTTT
ncbi:response regulator transcription factor [Umezawaea sp. Da 62-37]|uniref:response regulator transcription factor n=1 Tax=Umezawaea sp. Da 62-37 TaxID=3075927 RepID=UPI0028F731FB|nr:response regulator transcription factor [Umezawaea sp. Da 62-37]WNV87409.1 response regulator transcription factor [Umezawaea sp. Da 62-37]